ncbi:hypothetical protein [Streptomyces kanamyceticus]|nr:hypothetical protein [Streptomyces kanamyceticus]
MTPAGHSRPPETSQRGRDTFVGVLTIRRNDGHLLYQMRYHLTLSSASAEQTFRTVDAEELFLLLREIAERL